MIGVELMICFMCVIGVIGLRAFFMPNAGDDLRIRRVRRENILVTAYNKELMVSGIGWLWAVYGSLIWGGFVHRF